MLYSETVWNEFVEKILKSDKIKSYKHFDNKFNFKASGHLIKNMVSDSRLEKVACHSFLPHIKILTKTPRFKFDENLSIYGLETKIRPISYASHFDSYLYSFYAYSLTKEYEKHIKKEGFDNTVLAYRSDLNGDCNIQFAKKAFDAIKQMTKVHNKCISIALDIKGYFDNIDHILLKEKWCKIINQTELPKDQYQLFKSVTKYSYVNKRSILKHFKITLDKEKRLDNLLSLIPDTSSNSTFNEKFNLLRGEKLIIKNKPKVEKNGEISHKGIPQGSAMSAVLSNIYLIDFDKWLTVLSNHMGFHYFRYCDDLLIVCKSDQASYLIQQIMEEIKLHYKLHIQEKKTEIIEFRKNSCGQIRSFNIKDKLAPRSPVPKEERFYKNLQYLGFEFNGQNIYIRPGSLSRYFRKAKGKITKTIMMSYGKKTREDTVLKKQLYLKYTHFGKTNFIKYAQNASKKEYTNSSGILRQGLDSVSIRRQLASHFSIIEKDLKKTSVHFALAKKMEMKK